MTNIEDLENEKKRLQKLQEELQKQQEQIEKQIQAVEAEEEEQIRINIIGLYSRTMDSVIRTAASSFSDNSIGEVREANFRGIEIAESYSRTIDVELSGRYEDYDSEPCQAPSLTHLRKAPVGSEPTLVISFLIPFDLVEDDPYFSL